MFSSKSLAALTIAIAFAGTTHAAVLIDNDFGPGGDIGPAFQQFSNGQGSGYSADPSTGVIDTGNNVNNNNTGLNTVATVDASGTDGFTMTWTVSSADITPATGSGIFYNGWFFGVTNNPATNGSAIWTNSGLAVGVLIDGGSSYSDWQFVDSDGTKTQHALNGAPPTVASIEDGFTVTLTVNNDDTWEVSTTGLSNASTTTGSLSTNVTYADIAGTLVANTSIQGDDNLTYTVDHVTLETTQIPEPASLASGLLGLALLAARRRR